MKLGALVILFLIFFNLSLFEDLSFALELTEEQVKNATEIIDEYKSSWIKRWQLKREVDQLKKLEDTLKESIEEVKERRKDLRNLQMFKSSKFTPEQKAEIEERIKITEHYISKLQADLNETRRLIEIEELILKEANKK